MSVKLNLNQARQLLEFFGGEDASVTVSKLHNHAHCGPGVYAWLTEHPEEGSIKLDEEPVPEEWEHPCPFRGEPTKTPTGEACSACGMRESHINDAAAGVLEAQPQPFDRAAVLTIWQGMQYQGGINSAALATLFAQQVLAAHGLGPVPTSGVMACDPAQAFTEPGERRWSLVMKAMEDAMERAARAFADGTAEDYGEACIAFDDALSDELDRVTSDVHASLPMDLMRDVLTALECGLLWAEHSEAEGRMQRTTDEFRRWLAAGKTVMDSCEVTEAKPQPCKHCGESEPWVGLCDRMGNLCGKAAARDHAASVTEAKRQEGESNG